VCENMGGYLDGWGEVEDLDYPGELAPGDFGELIEPESSGAL